MGDIRREKGGTIVGPPVDGRDRLATARAQLLSEGVKLVGDTGERLGNVARVVEDINIHRDAIAEAAHEQAFRPAEVDIAVNHMDHATQQNAAMVENKAQS